MPINNKYPIKIEILTPLSIGCGAENDYVNGADYIVDGDYVYFLNLSKMVKCGIDINRMTTYIAAQDAGGLRQLIGSKLDEVTDRKMRKTVQSDNPIKAMISNPLTGEPIIPGSSLKGAIRSHVFNSLGGNATTASTIFGKFGQGEDLLRFVQVSDFDFIGTSLVNTKIFNLRTNDGDWQGGWKQAANATNRQFNATGFNTIYEVLMPGQDGYGSISLSPTMFERVFRGHIDQKRRKLLDLPTLFGEINRQTREYLERERHFFETYDQAQDVDKILDSIDRLLAQIPKDNSACILKMSAGSGFHSITGDWQFDDYTGKGDKMGRKPRTRGNEAENRRAASAKPKSRKIAIYDGKMSLMGFVRISIAKTNEANRKEKILKYNNLVDDAYVCLNNGDLDGARQHYAQAEALWPSGTRLPMLRDDICKKADVIKLQKYNDLIDEAIKYLGHGDIDEASRCLSEAIEINAGTRHNKLKEEIDNKKARMRMDRIETLLSDGDCKYAAKDYPGAKSSYEQAYQIEQRADIKQKIDDCTKKMSSASQTIDEFVNTLVISSTKAFITKCERRKADGNTFTNSDIEPIVKKILSANLNKAKKKEWLSPGTWQHNLYPIMGEEVAKSIYDKLKEAWDNV